MSQTWVLVADACDARIFSYEKGGELALIEELSHPESRLKGAAVASDRPGHYQSKGTGHGAFVAGSDPKEYEGERFAHQLAEYLDEGRRHNKYADLILVAAPHFHGVLNKSLNKHVKEMVTQAIEKDYAKVKEHDLAERLGLK